MAWLYIYFFVKLSFQQCPLLTIKAKMFIIIYVIYYSAAVTQENACQIDLQTS